MPELVARHFNAGSTEDGNIMIVILALLLLAACSFGLARFWCTWRGDLREHDQLEREEPYDDVDAADRIDSLRLYSGAQVSRGLDISSLDFSLHTLYSTTRRSASGGGEIVQY